MTRVVGLLLAAGAGRRMGGPKALLDRHGRAAVRDAVDVLRAGGCDDVVVVVGAQADRVAALIDAQEGVQVVRCDDWRQGMGASLRSGLAAVPASAEAVLVLLVDLPDVRSDVVARVLTAAEAEAGPAGLGAVLARAAYDGTPGHPVLLGADHLAGVAASAEGDRGGRGYLAEHAVWLVECGDLAGGHDVDTPAELPPR